LRYFALVSIEGWGIGVVINKSTALFISPALAVLAIASNQAWGQDSRPSADVGPMVAYPILTVGVGYSAGLKYVGPDDTGQEGEGSWTISGAAGGGLQGEYRGHLYGVEYEARWAGYASSSEDNYLDHRITAYGGTAFDVRNNLDLGVEYLKGHDPRFYDNPFDGGRDSRFAPEPDEWEQLQAGLNYTFGAPGARGRVECDICQTNRRYTNNDQEHRDNDILDLGIEFIAKVSPKTELNLGVVYSDFDYVNEDPADVAAGESLDSTEMRYYVGADWLPSPKIEASVDVGLLEKQFDNNSNRQDYSDLFFLAEVDWSPRSPTSFNAAYSRGLYERTLYGDEQGFGDDVVEADDLRAMWTEQWNERISTDLGGFYQWLDYRPSGREDTVYGVNAGVDYVLNRWVAVHFDAYYQERDSSDPQYSYDDSGFLLSLDLGSDVGWGALAPDICTLR